MPVDPSTWSKGDFVSATRLNGDAYAVAGQAFSPNGVRFHSQRPLYKAMQASAGLTVQSGAWRGIFQAAGANILVDTSGNYGVQMDPDYDGTIGDAVVYSNGNPVAPKGASGRPIGAGGGWYLVSSFIPIGGISANNFARVNMTNSVNGWNNNNPNLLSTGTAIAGNAAHDICPHVVDLIYFDGGSYMPVIQNGGTVTNPLRTTVDGSGETAWFSALWASVSAQYGFTASAVPAPATFTTATAATLNGATGLRDILRVFNMPPALRVAGGTSTSVGSGTGATALNLGTPQVDTYGGWNSGTNTYTVPMSGVYFVYGAVQYQAAGSTVTSRAGVSVGGNSKFGPMSAMSSGTANCTSTIRLLDLNAGDAIQLITSQVSGGALGTATTNPPVLILVWMGAKAGFPGTLPTVPDLSYRYLAQGASTPAQTPLASHLANDLSFLTWRPWFLSQQVSAQSLSQSTSAVLSMDTITGSGHATAGDPWSGWNAANNRWVAPVSGWYLAVMEVFFPQPTLTVTPSTLAQFRISTTGTASSNYDWYGHQNLPATQNSGGAQAMGFYYLRAGDWIEAAAQTQDTASGAFSTSTIAPHTHFEVIWVSE
jgi:hypothetical protein